jgi:hypothetical protein
MYFLTLCGQKLTPLGLTQLQPHFIVKLSTQGGLNESKQDLSWKLAIRVREFELEELQYT